MRMKEEYHPNPECATIHTGSLLTPGNWINTEHHEKSEWPEFLYKITSIPGVVECSVKKYELTITKGKVFAWDEIIPMAKEALHATFSAIPGIKID